MGYFLQAIDEKFHRTNPQLNTPFNNPPKEAVTEIEVTDPMHPLFGRRFPVLSVGSARSGAGYVLVTYHEHITLRIPRAATNLAPPRPGPQTKLTLEALTELISLAEQCEVLCPLIRPTSGANCPQNSNSKSSTTYPQFFRR